LKIEVADVFSVIGKVDYTVDSNADWIGLVPQDQVYDTTKENFEVMTKKLDVGEHIVTIKASDDVGNVTYKTFEYNLTGKRKK